jgi:hypothetical protein
MKDVFKMLKDLETDLAKIVKLVGKPRKAVREDDRRSLRFRLTPKQREKIKEMLSKGKKVSDICAKFGVSEPTVYGIRKALQKETA